MLLDCQFGAKTGPSRAVMGGIKETFPTDELAATTRSVTSEDLTSITQAYPTDKPRSL